MSEHKKDYRDELKEILDTELRERGMTRSRLCHNMGLDHSTLSNLIAKRRQLSVDKLEELLAHLDYEICFRKIKRESPSNDSPGLQQPSTGA